MIILKKIFFIKSLIYVLCFPLFLSAQQEEWGKGLLMLPIDSAIHINLYNTPNGEFAGTLGTEKSYDGMYFRNVWREAGGISLIIPDEALLEYEYEISGFIVYEKQQDFIQILFPKGERIAWVSISELEKKGASYQSWMTFMTQTNRTFFTLEYGMNVRKKPSVRGERIFTVKGDQFEITPTGKTKGLWAEVIIKEYDSEYCEGNHNLLKEYRGWLKILDDKGFPNLWYYTRGC